VYSVHRILKDAELIAANDGGLAGSFPALLAKFDIWNLVTPPVLPALICGYVSHFNTVFFAFCSYCANSAFELFRFIRGGMHKNDTPKSIVSPNTTFAYDVNVIQARLNTYVTIAADSLCLAVIRPPSLK